MLEPSEATQNILDRMDNDPDFEEDWRVAVAKMYAVGAGDREIMKRLKLTEEAWGVLYSDLACDFRELVDMGRVLAQSWWEEKARENLYRKDFNTPLWSFVMKNRYGWSERNAEVISKIDFSNKDRETLMAEVQGLIKQVQEHEAG